MVDPSRRLDSTDDISLLELYAKVQALFTHAWLGRRLLLAPILISLVVGICVLLFSPLEFTASAKLLPYGAGSGAGSGNLSGLAGLAGIRLPSGGGEQVISTDLYPDLVGTFDFVSAIAVTPLAFSYRDSAVTVAAYIRMERGPAAIRTLKRYSIGLPRLLREDLLPSNVDTSVQRTDLPMRVAPDFERAVMAIRARFAVNADKKSGIITISARMPDALAAANLVQIISDHLTRSVIAYEARKIDEQLVFIEEQLAFAKSRYDSAQGALVSFADRNRSLVGARSQVELSRLEREVQVTFELYQQFSREREQARIKRSQDSPVFTVLQKVQVPNERSAPNRSRVLLLALFAGLVFGTGRIFLRRLGNEKAP